MPIELKTHRAASDKTDVSAEVLRRLTEAIANIRYGSVEVLIHDARVVQIEAREKFRLGSAPQESRG